MPRSGWLALMPMVLWCLSGCAWTESVKSTAFLQRFRDRSISPDHAVIQVATIYRPLGDGYLNGRVWESTNELFMDLERHAALEENGFRVGQLVGSPPSDLQTLLLDSSCCLNCLRFRSFRGVRADLHLPQRNARAADFV